VIYVLALTNVLLVAGFAWLARRHLLALERLDEVNEKVEESLDVLDSSYNRLSRLLETPVLFDDPIVVEMLQSAKNARDSILVVANVIVSSNDEE